MTKYKVTTECKEYFKQIKIIEFAKKIGITRQTLSNIVNGHNTCNYTTAFTITKHINADASINNFFEEI